MSTIVTRAGKGSTLTFAEVDANFTNLNTDKLEFSSEPVRHSVRPSLLLDFANTKQLDPRITFTRASTAMFYDGKTTAMAEQNLLANSKDFTNIAYGWYTNSGFYATVTINDTTAPDGTTTGAKLAATATTNNFLRCQDSKQTVSTITTVSWFVKAGDVSWVALRNLAVSGSPYVWFNLSTGVVGTQQSGLTGSIQSVGSGWYRCSITGTTASSIANNFIDIVPCASDNSQTVVIGNYIYIWGAQIESRSAVSAYTPTTTAAITNYIPALQTAASGVARFDHNPTTGESLGLLIEEQRTNLFTYSDQFNNSFWTKGDASITANTLVAPDGTLTADQLIETATTNVHYVGTTTTPALNGITTTFSVYVKKGILSSAPNFIQLYLNFSVQGYANFNISNGTLGTTGGGATSSITPVGNGWYRCSITATPSTNCNAFVVFNNNNNSATAVPSYAGSTSSDVLIWGAQLEAGAFATSYIPTVASQVTRPADNASITGTNFSSWYRQDAGTFYSEANDYSGINNAYLAAYADGNNIVEFRGDGSLNRARVLIKTNGTFVVNTVSATSTQPIKQAASFTNGSVSSTANGALFVTNVNVQTPKLLTTLLIGEGITSSVKLNGAIKKIAYYPKSLTNAELQGLTTV